MKHQLSIFISLILLLFITSLQSVTAAGESETDSFQSNIIIPVSSEVETLITEAKNPYSKLSEYGRKIDPVLEQIYYNADFQYGEGNLEGSAELYLYSIWKAAELKETLTREQLYMILKQRAYRLVEMGHPSGALAIWDYGFLIWDGGNYKKDLPKGLKIQESESDVLARNYLADCYAEKAICLTSVKDFKSSWELMVKSAEIFKQTENWESSVYFLMNFLVNAFNLKEYQAVIDANPYISDFMLLVPAGQLAITDTLTLGRVTAVALMNTEHPVDAYQYISMNLQIADNAGYEDNYTEFDRALKAQLAEILTQAGN